MPPVLLRVPRRDPFDLDPESQPPHGQLAQAVDGMRRRKRDAVIGPNHVRKPKLPEGALEDREGECLLVRPRLQPYVVSHTHRGWLASRDRLDAESISGSYSANKCSRRERYVSSSLLHV
jgi:hypothetical protein